MKREADGVFAVCVLNTSSAKVRRSSPAQSKRFFPVFFVPATLGLAVFAVLAVLVVPQLRQPESEFQARGAETGTSAWGVRAFCIGPDGQVRGEARPGGTLACGEDGTVQFIYTAPEAARLSITAASPSGEPLSFFPREGEAADVAAGVDVPLPFSTPVDGGWLAGPLDVEARFTDAQGRPLSQTKLTLTPR